jgi:hypothetical protein
MYLLFIWSGFEVGKIHYEGHWKGWALEIETFLGPGNRDFFGPKKVKPPHSYSPSLHNNLEIDSAI